MPKQFVKNFVREIGLIYVADKIRFLFKNTFHNASNVTFLKENPDVPFPPPYMIYESHKLDYRKYYINGKASAAKLLEDFEMYFLLDNKNILDWGCGPARVIRHMAESKPKTNFYGSDYNQDSIAWCKENIKNAQFYLNGINPPTQFKSEFFDGIYGLSVFTHLSEENHYRWTKELSRILKIGGILIISTHGEVFKERLLKSEQRDFSNGKLIVQGNTLEGHRTYAAFQPPDFMKTVFSETFEIIQHVPGKRENWGLSQDKWILKKIK